jgi:predicted TIM-barrel fold metal-dependent hydrolase
MKPVLVSTVPVCGVGHCQKQDDPLENAMPPSQRGPIDCDIHPAVPDAATLLPFLPGHWADAAVQRGFTDLEPATYPVNAPFTTRADWRPPKGKGASNLALLQKHALDHWGTSIAICNCLYGVHLIFSSDMAVAYARAVNSWMVQEWLNKDARLRASIVIPLQDPARAVEEIELQAGDRRFVQVLMPVSAEMPLGKPHYWPIYQAAERLGLPVGLHAGSMYRQPVTALGWGSYHAEDYVAQAQGFQSALASLLSEGVFGKFPDLKFVFIESGFTWLPACLWRLEKYWRALRLEIPWVDRSPIEITRRSVRLTLQPVDAPPTAAQFTRFLDHMGSDELLLFSTDYPHWQFDGDAVLPEGMPADLAKKIQFDNPMATYGRLAETVPA